MVRKEWILAAAGAVVLTGCSNNEVMGNRQYIPAPSDSPAPMAETAPAAPVYQPAAPAENAPVEAAPAGEAKGVKSAPAAAAYAPMTGVTSSGGVDSAPRRKGAVKKGAAPVKGGYYVVRPGDFPQKIARKCRVRLSDLMAANDLTAESAKRLRVGQKLVIPGKGAVRKGAANRRSSAPASAAVEVKDGVYVVKSGDFPQKIARKLKVKLSDLMELNNLTPEKAARLQIGQKLLVPGAAGAATAAVPAVEAAPVEAAPVTPAVEAAPVEAAPAGGAAAATGSDSLAATIDAAKSADVTAAAPAAGSEIVVESDSEPVMVEADAPVADFAAKYGTTVEKIRQMNPDFTGDTVKKDMVIFVPGKRK